MMYKCIAIFKNADSRMDLIDQELILLSEQLLGASTFSILKKVCCFAMRMCSSPHTAYLPNFTVLNA